MPIPNGATHAQIESRIDEVLSDLSISEKVAMLSGHGFIEQVAEDGGRYCARLYHIGAGNERLGIPPLLFNDGPRGIAMGSSTCFPVSMARGASFDVDLERRIGDAIGRELRAHGGNLFGGVCINLLRHPAWGRAQETYGEDPFLLGEMGAALTRGVQHHNVVATPKHFAANSMENARFKVDVKADERTLREVYLPHFKRCIDAGAGAVMSAYNQLNGSYCGHNYELLTKILKEEWGFEGFVYSDFILGCRGWDACAAGLDVEAPDTHQFGDHLLEAVRRGDVAEERIDDGVSRVLRSLFRTLAAPDPERYGLEVVACDAHVALAREAAEKSIVLLKNDALLPLDPASARRVLVLGALADSPNLGDHGSSRVYPPEVVTPLAGLRERAPEGCEVLYEAGDERDRLRAAAEDADVVVVVVGYTHREEGEFIPGQSVDLSSGGSGSIGGDRTDLTLGEEAESLIEAVADAHANVVVVVMSGSAVLMERWRHRVNAILMLWYPGMQGGAALADVLFGRVNPSGRLPFTIPVRAADLPFFDRDAEAITYDLWHGYTKFERDGSAPAFAFGCGLSYSDFEFGTPVVRPDLERDLIEVETEVRNVGARAGDAVLQVYAGGETPVSDQPRKRLCGFRRVQLDAGAARLVKVNVQVRDLASFDPQAGGWHLHTRRWRIFSGASSRNEDLGAVSVSLPERSWKA